MLSFNIDRVSKIDNIFETLKHRHAVYHKSCYDNHNDYILKRLLKPKKRKNEENDHNDDNDRCSNKIAIRSPESNITLGSNVCMFCEETDLYSKLIAAGTKHASSSKVKTVHVGTLTSKLRDMALFLNDSKLLPKLSTGDVISNELFYHKVCYLEYLNRHRSAVNASKRAMLNSNEEDAEYIKAMCFNRIMMHIYEKGQEQDNVSFEVSELENLYSDLLSSNGIHYATYVSRFAEKLTTRIPGLEVRTIKNKLSVFFKRRVDECVLNHVLEPDSFMRSVTHEHAY